MLHITLLRRDADHYDAKYTEKAMSTSAEIERLLIDPGGGPDSVDRLVPLVYAELRRLAHAQLADERPGHTLQTTALVHEAYLRIAGDARVTAQGRAYFLAAAARAMRRVLVDHARRHRAAKRGGGRRPVSLIEEDVAVDNLAADLVSLDDALERLASEHPRHARVVECRFFAGLGVEETAEALGVSPRTVKNDWSLARAWLSAALA